MRCASSATAKASPISRGRLAGPLAITAPTDRRIWRCSRCTRRWRRTAGDDADAVFQSVALSHARARVARFCFALAPGGARRAAGDLVAVAGDPTGAAPDRLSGDPAAAWSDPTRGDSGAH